MNKLTLTEGEEFGKDYHIVDIELDDMDTVIPGFIRTTLDGIKMNNKYVNVITHDNDNTEIEYFESSVRSNRKGAAFIDRNGNRDYKILGKTVKETEKLQNLERSQTLREFLDESLENTEFPRSGF